MKILDKGKKYIFDLILISFLLLLSLSVYFLFFYPEEEGARVVVYKSNEAVASYSLMEDGEYSLNGGKNILKIEDGKAYMMYADCPDGWCKMQGKISYVGERIACLPNGIILMIEED